MHTDRLEIFDGHKLECAWVSLGQEISIKGNGKG